MRRLVVVLGSDEVLEFDDSDTTGFEVVTYRTSTPTAAFAAPPGLLEALRRSVREEVAVPGEPPCHHPVLSVREANAVSFPPRGRERSRGHIPAPRRPGYRGAR